MGFSRLQGAHGTQNNAATSLAVTLGAAPIVGNVVCVALLWTDGGNPNAGTVTAVDNNGKAYTRSPNSPASARPISAGDVYLLYLVVPAGAGATITVSWTTPSTALVDLWVVEFSVSGGTAAFDNDAAGTGSTGVPINAPTVPVTGSGELLFSAAVSDHQVSSVDAPWTQEAAGTGNPFSEGVGYLLSASANTPVAMSQNTSSGWDAMGMSFSFTPVVGVGKPWMYYAQQAQIQAGG